MFVARCIAVSLAAFLLSYCAFSAVVAGGWALLQKACREKPARHAADLLFTLRILPLVVSTILTCAFTVPSFLLLEPRVSNEAVGAIPVLLGFGCVMVLAAGLSRACKAQRRSAQVVAGWLRESRRIGTESEIPVFQTELGTPPLTLAGVCTCKVLVSKTALQVLCPQELGVAMKHELAHARRYDNLKKLLFQFSPFPGMAPLESAWLDEAELAADDAAVSSFSEALDLASALIKLSRMVPVQASPAMVEGLLHGSLGSLSVRVQRLFAWRDAHQTQRRRRSWQLAMFPLAVTAMVMTATYGRALWGIHEVTEWLVR
jgi:Zn-dependent protease with chaperone function